MKLEVRIVRKELKVQHEVIGSVEIPLLLPPGIDSTAYRSMPELTLDEALEAIKSLAKELTPREIIYFLNYGASFNIQCEKRQRALERSAT